MARVVLRHKITFDMEVQDIKQLESAFSEQFVIRGLKWKFKVKRIAADQEENQMEDMVGVWLHCNIPNELKDYMCGAQARIKLISFQDNKEPLQKCISGVFDSEHTCFRHDSSIEWTKLFDDGYVRDDALLFQMELRVGPLEHKTCNSLIIKTNKDKYEHGKQTTKLLKLILNRIDDDFISTKSTTFKFNGVMWQIEISKWFDGEEDIFMFELYCDGEQSSKDWSCELSAKLKLMPVNADSAPIGECENFKFDENESCMAIYPIEWSKLEAQFVKNETIEMMLELKVETPSTAN